MLSNFSSENDAVHEIMQRNMATVDDITWCMHFASWRTMATNTQNI